MNSPGYYAYLRTSTIKQGVQGVSLEVQKDEAQRLAQRKGFAITKFFVEMETAAKQGRPVFKRMMKDIRAGKAEGLVLHKIDRGARTLRDWSEITDLHELGFKLEFVHDGIDLSTRGGRLTGDLLAAIAADYVRNLREETMKGIIGRLNQGLWPFGAPLGYRNNGKAKPKTIDPVCGPLVRQAFELYSTGDFTLVDLSLKLFSLGLRSNGGGRIGKNALSGILTNPFYFGLLTLKSTGERFQGIHEPLVSQLLFDRVQQVLAGRLKRRLGRHNFLYRCDIFCASCKFKLIGERQKGYTYYRCHTKECAGTSIREEMIDAVLMQNIALLSRFVDSMPQLEHALKEALEKRRQDRASVLAALRIQSAKLDERLNAATDALIDGVLDKETFTKKKNEILEMQSKLRDSIVLHETSTELPASYAERYLEIAEILRKKPHLASAMLARQLVKSITSNFMAHRKVITLQWVGGFEYLIEHAKLPSCAHAWATARTVEHFSELLLSADNVPMSPSIARYTNE